MKKKEKTTYMNLNEWLDEYEGYITRGERLRDDLLRNPRNVKTWIEECWKQASRTARIQELILESELYQMKQKEDA